MKMSARRFYRKIDGKYEYDEPDVHKRHRRVVRRHNTKLLRRRLGKYIGTEK